MTLLKIFKADQPDLVQTESKDPATITRLLAEAGIQYARTSLPEFAAGTAPTIVLEACREQVEQLKQRGGYATADVVSLAPDHPDRKALRQKFLSEHRHAEDEVRLFARGAGLFSLHVGEQVYALRCERGDLVSVPAGTPHWFDMGARPDFIAIRLFTNPDGWVADFTGDDIASRFPDFDSFLPAAVSSSLA